MTIRKLFPKSHAIFSNDEALVRSLKALEDRIEQSYLVDELTLSLAAIAELTESSPVLPKDFNHLSPELLRETEKMFEAMAPIFKDVADPTPFERDRDTIWRLVSKYGKPTVLMFISPRLMLNLEVLFTGIVWAIFECSTSRRGVLGSTTSMSFLAAMT